MGNKNIHFDRVFSQIGRNIRNQNPDTMTARELAREFQRLAAEFQVVPPEEFHAATGHQFTVEMLQRASVIMRGLSGLSDAFESVDQLGRMRNHFDD